MRITIITPTLNSEKTIKKCIQSVTKQSFKDIEYLIIDGVSKDNTLDIIKNHDYNKVSFKYLSEPDNGIYDAMNKGIDLAKGDWIYFLGSDDYLYSENTIEQIFNLQDIESFDIVYGDVYNNDSEGIYGGAFNYERLVVEEICHQSVFYRKEIFKKFGNYNTAYKIYADSELNRNLFCNKQVKWKYVNLTVASYSGKGASSNTFDLNYWKNIKTHLLGNFATYLSKKKIYRGMIPYFKYHTSFHSLCVAFETAFYMNDLRILLIPLKNYFAPFRLFMKKIVNDKA